MLLKKGPVLFRKSTRGFVRKHVCFFVTPTSQYQEEQNNNISISIINYNMEIITNKFLPL